MKINPDQPKRIINTEQQAKQGAYQLDMITFITCSGQAYGCRVHSERESEITDLFSTFTEAITAGIDMLDKYAKMDEYEKLTRMGGMSLRITGEEQ